ncbi:MAG: LysR family transcriptional regulator [Firmicutes bacterium]|nr:LysR family transcriptional regulator [Bacillota bacterium]
MAPPKIDIHNKSFSYILAIAECGTITLAAEKLYISQPALSRYLKGLEDRIGLKLFDRIDNRLVLSSAGKQYVRYARQISDMEAQMERALTQLRSEDQMFIRVGIPEHWSSFLVPQILNELPLVMPHINLEIVDVNSKHLEQLLLDYQVDLTISRKPTNQQAITSQFLHFDPIYLAVPMPLAASLRTVGTSSDGLPIIDNRELANLKYIMLHKGQRLRDQVDQIFQSENILPRITQTIRSAETALHLTGDVYGCCFVSRMHMHSVHLQKSPVYFAINHPQAMLSLHVSYLAGRTLPPYMHKFIFYVSQLI